MKARWMYTITAALVGGSAGFALAQPLPAPAAKDPVGAQALQGQLRELGWLSGVWRGRVRDDQVEEVYGPLSDNEILATFKAVTAGKVSRYELRSIRLEDGRIRFAEIAGPALDSIAPVPTRTLVSIDAIHIVFEGLTLTRLGANRMSVAVSVKSPDGLPRTVRFDLTRVLGLALPRPGER
jgi:Domain of unknown function (DUF6265)